MKTIALNISVGTFFFLVSSLNAMNWESKPRISKSFKSTSENATVSDVGAYELCLDYLGLYSTEQWAEACSGKSSSSGAYCKLDKSVSSFYGEITTWYKVDCR